MVDRSCTIVISTSNMLNKVCKIFYSLKISGIDYQITILAALLTRRHSVERIPPPRPYEIFWSNSDIISDEIVIVAVIIYIPLSFCTYNKWPFRSKTTFR